MSRRSMPLFSMGVPSGMSWTRASAVVLRSGGFPRRASHDSVPPAMAILSAAARKLSFSPLSGARRIAPGRSRMCA